MSRRYEIKDASLVEFRLVTDPQEVASFVDVTDPQEVASFADDYLPGFAVLIIGDPYASAYALVGTSDELLGALYRAIRTVTHLPEQPSTEHR